MISEKAHRRLNKACALRRIDHPPEVTRVRPATDRKQQLEMAVRLLVLKELVKVATQVGRTRFAIALVLDLLIRPRIGELHRAGSRVYVGKRIKDVGEVRKRHMLGLVAFLVDGPVGKVAYVHVA